MLNPDRVFIQFSATFHLVHHAVWKLRCKVPEQRKTKFVTDFLFSDCHFIGCIIRFLETGMVQLIVVQFRARLEVGPGIRARI